jgi:hypothetical protein
MKIKIKIKTDSYLLGPNKFNKIKLTLFNNTKIFNKPSLYYRNI